GRHGENQCALPGTGRVRRRHARSELMKVSVVTPSYNQGQFIERTLASVASQSSAGFELEHVVFDGGSTDDTVAILERAGDSVRWTSGRDGGQTDAVNKGIRATD